MHKILKIISKWIPELHKRLALLKNLDLNSKEVDYLNAVDLQPFPTQKVDFHENYTGQRNPNK